MASLRVDIEVIKRRWIAKERAFVPLLGSNHGAILNTTFEEPKLTQF